MAIIWGTNGVDNLTGTRRKDQILGLEADDTIAGGDGDDTLNGGFGRDLMQGNAGNDVYIVDNSRDVVQELSSEGTDLVIISSVGELVNYYTIPNNVENLLYTYGSQAFGNNLNNHITGNLSGNVLSGNHGNDTLDGLGYDDSLFGGNGRDRLNGNEGNDRLYGGYGNDVLNGDDDIDFLRGSGFGLSDSDTLIGGNGGDIFYLGDLCYYDDECSFDFQTYYAGEGHATIADFSRDEGDKIKIAFYLDNYTLNKRLNFGGALNNDTAIYYQGDLIAIVFDNSLRASDFDQLGYDFQSS